MAKLLTPTEKTDLARCESEVQENLKGFFDHGMKIGKALKYISDNELWKESYRSFSHYLTKKWEIDPSNANKLMSAAGVRLMLEKKGKKILPQTVSQTKPLQDLSDHQAEQAWDKSVDQSEGKQPKPKVVREAVQNQKIVKDSNGKEVPESLLEIFNQRDALDTILKSLHPKLKETALELSRGPLGELIDMKDFDRIHGLMFQMFNDIYPRRVCACNGDNSSICKKCEGWGYHS